MIDKLLIEHHLEFLSLKGGCRGSSESTIVKIDKKYVSLYWKEYVFLRKQKNKISVKKN